MPDQNNPADINPTQGTPPAPPDVPAGDASVPPPFPPETPPIEGAAPPPDMGAGSAAPSYDIPPVVTPIGKPKGGGRKVIATILGLLVLVGGLGAGIILVRQQQDIRERAATISCTASNGQKGTCTAPGDCTGQIFSDSASTLNCKTTSKGGGGGAICCVPDVADGKCVGPGEDCASGKSYFDASCPVTETRCGTKPQAPAPTPYCTKFNKDDCTFGCEPTLSGGKCKSAPSQTPQAPPGGAFGEVCESKGGKCVSQELAASNFITVNGQRVEGYLSCVQAGGGLGAQDCPANEVCVKCEGTSTTPTTPDTSGGGPTAQCLNIKAFDTNWTELTSAQLAELKVGDTVRFTVAGQASSGSFDKARFKVNGVQKPEVTGKRPGTEEYYDEYTIPEGITTFTINAQIHHTVLGWSN